MSDTPTKAKKNKRRLPCTNHIDRSLENRVASVKERAGNLRDVCEAFLEVPEDVMVSVETGETFDLRTVKIKKHVPDT